MHFSSTTLVSLLAASTVSASPIVGKLLDPKKSVGEWKECWENKWKNNEWKKHEKVFQFDQTYTVKAVPDEVRNGTEPAPGQKGAKGIYIFGINTYENTICYNITLSGVTGEYQSPALTATHIHEAARGASGPPRLAFPNPQGPDEKRVSYGCLTGPFKTGLKDDEGNDTGDGFHVSQIVENPAGFFADTHTKQFTLGAVRGQLA